MSTNNVILSAINEDCKRVGFALAHSYHADALVKAGMVVTFGHYGQMLKITDKGRMALSI